MKKTLEHAVKKGLVSTEEVGLNQGEASGPTVIDAIQALNRVCDGATSKDKAGFSKFDREEKGDLIQKAVSEGCLSPKEERVAFNFLKKYKKQLKGLGVDYDAIGHINATGGIFINYLVLLYWPG